MAKAQPGMLLSQPPIAVEAVSAGGLLRPFPASRR